MNDYIQGATEDSLEDRVTGGDFRLPGDASGKGSTLSTSDKSDIVRAERPARGPEGRPT